MFLIIFLTIVIMTVLLANTLQLETQLCALYMSLKPNRGVHASLHNRGWHQWCSPLYQPTCCRGWSLKGCFSGRIVDSQRDDSRGKALGDGLGVHAEGAVFGAGAGRRAARHLRGFLGVRFPRQAEAQTHHRHEHQPQPSRAELRQHPGAGKRRLGAWASWSRWRGDTHTHTHTQRLPNCLSACLSARSSVKTERRETVWEGEEEEAGRRKGASVSPRWVWVLCSFPWFCFCITATAYSDRVTSQAALSLLTRTWT